MSSKTELPSLDAKKYRLITIAALIKSSDSAARNSVLIINSMHKRMAFVPSMYFWRNTIRPHFIRI